MLGGFLMSTSGIIQSKKYVPRAYPKDALSKGNKPSAEYLKVLRNNQNTGLINPEDLSQVQNQLAKIRDNRSFGIEWKDLGPDNFGGRTRAIVFDNKDESAKTAYAASVTGGIWKTTDIGITWTKINQETSNLNASCMIQTENGDIYVGTGESFAADAYSGLGELGFSGGFMGSGIYKSTDGDNFTLLNSTTPIFNTVDSDWAFVNELAFNQAKNHIYSATNSGLKYSTDGGTTWAIAKDADGNELLENSTDVQAGLNGLVIASVNNLAYVSYDGNPDNFVLRSIEDSTGFLPAASIKRIEFAIAPSDENIVYASVVNHFEEIYNVYRSENKGESWDIILPGTEALVILGGQGIYNNAITVFPDNPNKILLGGINLLEGNLIQETGFFAWKTISQGFVSEQVHNYIHVDQHVYSFRPGHSNQFLIGTDGGIYKGTFSQEEYTYISGNRNYNTTQFYGVGISGLEKYVIGGAQDNGSILITGKGNTVQQGVEIMNLGAFQNGGDGGQAVISFINKDVLVASTSYGTIKRSEDAGDSYSTDDQFSEGIENTTSFMTPMAIWESFDNPNSRDSIKFFNRTIDTISAGTKTLAHSSNSDQPFYFDMPYDLLLGDSITVVDPISSRFFLATGNNIYMIKDLHDFTKKPDWWKIANNSNTVYSGNPQCIAYSSDANYLFVGNRNGKLYRISNLALAYNFDRADVSSPSCVVAVDQMPIYEDGTSNEISQVITSIAVDPQNANNVMVTLGNYGNAQYVLYTSNALDEVPVFTSKQGNLPTMPAFSSLIEMKDGNKAFIGTEHGIFTTENITATSPVWEKDNNMMGNVPVFDIKQQLIGKERMTVQTADEEFVYDGVHNKGLIYAATYGRGLFYCNNFWQPIGINEIFDSNDKNLSLLVYPNPAINNVNIEIEGTTNSDALISVYDISGRLVSSMTNMISQGSNVINIEISNLNKGTYLVVTKAEGKTYSNKLMVK
jgi:hypothetical protein